MPIFFRWLMLLSALSVAGCATKQIKPPAPDTLAIHQQHLASLERIKQFDLQGRIGVQMEGRGYSATTHWQHYDAGDNVEIFSPLGGKIATIISNQDDVVLTTSEGKSLRAANVETLTQQALGWSLPIQGLAYWVLGRPSANSASSAVESSEWDETGKLVKLKQDGWNIEYVQYIAVDGYQLPSKVNLFSPKLNLKFVVEQWDVSQSRLAGNIEGRQ